MSRLNLEPGPVASFPTATPAWPGFRRQAPPLPAELRPRSYLVNAGVSTGSSDPGLPDPYARPPGAEDPTSTPIPTVEGSCGCG